MPRPGSHVATTLAAAGMLALGIGVTTALFSAIDAVLLRPLPVTDADRVIVAWTHDVERGYAHFPVVEGGYRAVRDGATTLSGVAAVDAWGWGELSVSGSEGLRSVRQARVLGDFFGLLGVQPVLGRLTDAADDVRGGPGYAVLSHGLWQRAFGGRADAIGRTLRVGVGDRPLTVAGVLPPDFDYPHGAELWTPMLPAVDSTVRQLELDLVTRMRPGATEAQVRAEIERLLRATPELERTYGGTVAVTQPLREHLLGDIDAALLVLLGAAVLVLAIATANVANLLLVRGAARSTQIAVRMALGADRGRLLRHLLAEGATLGLLGAAGGIAVAWATLRLIVPLAPADVPRLDAAGLDPRALAFAALVMGIVVLACTAAPGLAMGRIAPAAALAGGRRSTGATPGRNRIRRVLGATQIALAVAALVGAQLLVRSYQRLNDLDPGFRSESLHLVTLAVPYPVFAVPPSYIEALRGVAEQLVARGDIAAAVPALAPPLAGSGVYAAPLQLEGQTREEMRNNPLLTLEVAFPGDLEALGIRMVTGRSFEPTDGAGAPRVLVVGETTARLHWPAGDAIGQRVRLPFPGSENDVWTVVGVAADTRYQAAIEPRPAVYLPLLQFGAFAPARLLVRTRASPPDLHATVQGAFDEADPRVRVLGTMPVDDILDRPRAAPRFAAVVLAFFAVSAVLLAAAGVYAVMAAMVRERMREYGIRMALGARVADIWRVVLRHGLTSAAFGIVTGGILAIAAARRAGSLLFGVAPAEPVGLLAAALLILAVTILASAAPALRAGRTDPADVLRAE